MHMTTSMKIYKFIAKIGTAIAKITDAIEDDFLFRRCLQKLYRKFIHKYNYPENLND